MMRIRLYSSFAVAHQHSYWLASMPAYGPSKLFVMIYVAENSHGSDMMKVFELKVLGAPCRTGSEL